MRATMTYVNLVILILCILSIVASLLMGEFKLAWMYVMPVIYCALNVSALLEERN